MKASLVGRDNVVLDVWYYYCAYVYVVHVAFVRLYACGVVYI